MLIRDRNGIRDRAKQVSSRGIVDLDFSLEVPIDSPSSEGGISDNVVTGRSQQVDTQNNRREHPIVR